MLTLSRWLILLMVLLVFNGCAKAPDVYTMKPSRIESIRTDISTVGVSVAPELAKTEVLRPAKGVWGGLKRGVMVGASMPVMIGLASPIPGGTFLGLLVSPGGALVGGVYGVYTAVPAEEVEHADAMLALASENLKKQGLREDFIATVIDRGNRFTPIMFVELPERDDQGEVLPSGEFEGGIDAKLAIRVERVGLRGIYSIDPPVDTFIQIHVQLIGLKDDAALLDERFTCASDQERSFSDWADYNGSDLIDEFRSCIPELAEKIVDDFFRVYPIKWRYSIDS